MSKIFKVKKWVTTQQAIDFLSLKLEESLSRLDILQLIAEKELQFSVKFEYRVPAKIGKITQFKDAPLHRLPNSEGGKEILFPLGKCLAPDLKGGKNGSFEWDDDTPFACFENHVGYIDGIWDFAMIGNEVIDIENQIREEKKLEPMGLLDNGGVFLCRPDGTCANLHAMFIPDEEKAHYSDASSLFQHASLGFRTAELIRFLEKIDNESKPEMPLMARERNTLLSIVGGLLELMLETTQGGQRGSVYESQAAIASALEARHKDKSGISKTTLENKFAAAKRILNSG